MSVTCSQAPEAIVTLINGSFTGGEHLEDDFAVTAPNEIIYVGGNIVSTDGTKVSSADVWLVDDSEAIYVVHALSRDARKRPLWPDGRDLASAGDEYGSAVIDCATGR
jgi:hypothetical protein